MDEATYNFLMTCRFYIEGIAMLPVSVVGIIGNFLSILVLSCPEMQSDFNHLLLALSVFDFLYLLMSTFIFSLPLLSNDYADAILPHIWPIGFALAHIGRVGSVMMTLAVTVERFCAILFPLRNYRMKKLLIASATLFTVIYNIPRFFEFKTVEFVDTDNITSADVNETAEKDNMNEVKYRYEPTDLRHNPVYVKTYVVWGKFFLIELIPYVLISVLNALIIKKILKASRKRSTLTNQNGHPKMSEDAANSLQQQQKKEKNMAIVLVSIVILFLICQSLKIAPDVYEAVMCGDNSSPCEPSIPMEIIISVSHLLLTVNSAANFAIYILRGDKFRQIFQKLICRCQWTKASRRSPNNSQHIVMAQRQQSIHVSSAIVV